MQTRRSPFFYAAWTMYLVGCALVFGSYVRIVPVGLAWLGWVIGMLGWFTIGYARRTGRG